MITDVGFFGLGAMGLPMAKNLLGSGVGVHAPAWRSRGAVESFRAAGGLTFESIAGIPSHVTSFVVMAPSAAASEEIVSTLLSERQEGVHVLDCSSVPPELARKLAARSAPSGGSYTDAPVSGGVGGAESGTLTFMIGASPSEGRRWHGLLEIMGDRLFYLEDVGAGQVVKAANNLVGASCMASSAIALQMARAGGVDQWAAREVILTGTGANWQLDVQLARKAMVGDLAPGFAIPLLLKDLAIARNMLENAEGLAFADELVRLFEWSGQLSDEGRDFSALYTALGDESGGDDDDHSES